MPRGGHFRIFHTNILLLKSIQRLGKLRIGSRAIKTLAPGDPKIRNRRKKKELIEEVLYHECTF